ncbi:G1/S-specific cyclin-E-like isoform X2 [Contarinia nasturtii]|nr:G1/S-specific cyclin-E-like isoform X2 [Contarinia nasturtii]
MATKSEMVASTVSGSNNSGSNKRKRRASFDEIDIENQRPPPAKKVYSSSGEDLDSASDIENDAVELDLYAIASSPPQSVGNLRQKNDGGGGSGTGDRNIRTIRNTNSTSHSTINNNDISINNNDKTPITKCTKCHSRNDLRICPLPLLSWADAKDVWRFMCDKDKKTSMDRSPKMLQKHQGLQPRMRAILLDWLCEVCEVYKLHRETYYLALDYLDRYLSTKVSISKTFLQLIGITCLFIAAKVEEIYPPKLSEFAYVTDGACSEEDILKQELVILSALQWQTSPITIIGWLGIYMQLQVSNRTPKTYEETPQKQVLKDSTATQTSHNEKTSTTNNGIDDGFVFPQFSGMEYAQTAQLIDLCTLDVEIANFPYSVIAAAAISHTFNKKVAIKLSGLEWATIAPCYRWMEPYFQVILQQPKLILQEKHEQIESKQGMNSVCPNINTDDSHIIQMHTTTMDMFDQAALYRDQCLQEASPAPIRKNIEHICPPDGLLTPPDSSRKFSETHPDSNYK